MNPIKKWNSLSLFTRIMVGFVLGIGAGLVLGEKASAVAFLGTILTRLLTMVVAPLVLRTSHLRRCRRQGFQDSRQDRR